VGPKTGLHDVQKTPAPDRNSNSDTSVICEILIIPHCLDSRLTDGGKAVSPTHRSRYTPQKHFSASCTHFCYRLNKPQGLVRPEGLGKLKKIHSSHRDSNPRPSGL
jgi:hypothetical protein